MQGKLHDSQVSACQLWVAFVEMFLSTKQGGFVPPPSPVKSIYSRLILDGHLRHDKARRVEMSSTMFIIPMPFSLSTPRSS